MKVLDKLALKVFSILVLVIAVVIILMISGILPYDLVEQYLKLLSDYENGIKITIGVLAVLILLAVKGFFFTSKQTDNSKDGIVLENTSGKLVISKESLENLIASVIKDISNELQTKIKEAMKRTADLDVKEVNIKIKNITSKKVKGLPSPVDDETEEVQTEDNQVEEEKNGEE